MSYLNACTLVVIDRNFVKKYFGEIYSYRIACSYPARQIFLDEVANIENVPALKLKNNEDFANAEMCNICKQPFNQQRGVNRHHWYILSHAAESVRIPFAGNAVVKRSITNVPATFAS